jgi:hypothetical protein
MPWVGDFSYVVGGLSGRVAFSVVRRHLYELHSAISPKETGSLPTGSAFHVQYRD